MNEFSVVLSAVLPVLAIAVAGVAMRKLNWLTEEADQSLLRVTVNLLVPAFIFDKVLGNHALNDPANVIIAPLVGFGTVGLGIGLAWLALRVAGLNRDATGRTFAFSTGIYNYGYVPLPLAIALFNRETVGVLIVHNIGVEIAFWTLGTVVFAHAANEPLWKKILSPPLVAILLTLTLNFTGAASHIPEFVKTTAHMIGACAIPMGLVLIGAVIADHLAEFHSQRGWRVMATACALRLGIVPLLFLLLAKFLPCSVELKRVIVLQSAMPSAVFAILAARHFGGDAPTSLRVIIATSALSFVTIPLWIRLGMKWVGL
ncbi:MAG: AEC family transporter [Limisphaerales bacterium]